MIAILTLAAVSAILIIFLEVGARRRAKTPTASPVTITITDIKDREASAMWLNEHLMHGKLDDVIFGKERTIVVDANYLSTAPFKFQINLEKI